MIIASARAEDARFRYNGAGLCVDSLGVIGLNQPHVDPYFAQSVPYHDSQYIYTHIAYARGDGECTDFSSFDFTARMGTQYNSLVRWNFRGARLSGAKFALSAIIDSDISGADISNFISGYIYLRGNIDAYTKLPKEQLCSISKDKIVCRN
jgi:hypothetical protein